MKTSVVDLWLCSLSNLDDQPDNVSQLKKRLTADEIAKVERYRMPSSQIQALYVRNYLRKVLSRYSDLMPEAWRFEYGEKGKPSLVVEQQLKTGLNFNISHSKEHLLIAVCQIEGKQVQLGVDIEHARSSTNIDSIMKHYFSDKELADLLELSKEEQRERFFDLWALKESYIKATGKGLATSLRSFSFEFSNLTEQTLPIHASDFQPNLQDEIRLHGEISIYSGVGLDVTEKTDSSTDWQCCLGRLDEQYRFAVTLGGASLPMQLEMRTFSSSHLF
ncbi:4'-phosphopantetheinyl transferase superfamily protein [Vibrio splendidus]|uniref:4'-phosphopantetheinyl transferase family protein n=1 Tax=Vibrio splendidus TaxID=29497 RepID=UPI00246885D1|nr:4'-phosphopantetheinyl transferase superfamily protein [Vibrio splendidus]MDH5910303.1 4'-phosphopantetheinyl transferase superfamily protein [Vibrio splendidus]MDH5943913.1 4'-phosphopantetheinyl transferase superfamily protein [Vibrio splendidus]MDH5987430.1 4'-phosphopantetheinyl transferase superfamily protein [Vibrio splendidus]MDH5994734.1 4'-phosphopantetheinyl transferase superfamily protein [Vibrio splendidus]MDH6006452.1 4'-phosphopantetheinyl transferase superfamily protein [Vibr